MDEESNDFERLLQRAREGCAEAATELYERFAEHVLRVVRKKLSPRLRRRYDSEDFTQSVWRSFFDATADRHSFPTPDSLVAFLSEVARNKVRDTTRQRLGTQRHDMEREQSLDAPHPEQGGAVGETVPAHLATPSQYVIADERWQRLIEGQPPGHRRVLELLRDGYSHVDIAEKLGIHRKVIQRLLEELQYYMEAP